MTITKIRLPVLNELFMVPVPEPQPALQNSSNQQNSFNFWSYAAAFDLDDTLESDGIVNLCHSLSLSPAKKTTEIEILQKSDLEVQCDFGVCFTAVYVHHFPFSCPQNLWKVSCITCLFMT